MKPAARLSGLVKVYIVSILSCSTCICFYSLLCHQYRYYFQLQFLSLLYIHVKIVHLLITETIFFKLYVLPISYFIATLSVCYEVITLESTKKFARPICSTDDLIKTEKFLAEDFYNWSVSPIHWSTSSRYFLISETERQDTHRSNLFCAFSASFQSSFIDPSSKFTCANYMDSLLHVKQNLFIA